MQDKIPHYKCPAGHDRTVKELRFKCGRNCEENRFFTIRVNVLPNQLFRKAAEESGRQCQGLRKQRDNVRGQKHKKPATFPLEKKGGSRLPGDVAGA